MTILPSTRSSTGNRVSPPVPEKVTPIVVISPLCSVTPGAVTRSIAALLTSSPPTCTR